MMGDLEEFLTPEQLVDMAMYDLGMDSSTEGLTDAEIKAVIHYLGVWATQCETPGIESSKISSFGIGIMLAVCLQVFPDYFSKFELWQEN
jgi:hypothetical protein